MPRSIRARLDDILDAVHGIQTLLGGVSFSEFAGAWHLQRATERGLEIASLGNLLRHEYQRIEPLVIWNIAEEHLLGLELAVQAIVTRLDGDQD